MKSTEQFLITTKSKKYAYFYFNPNNIKYTAIQLNADTKERKNKLGDYVYTVVYKHETYKVYGLVKDKDFKPTLYWITADDLKIKQQKEQSQILPFNEEELVDLTSCEYNIFNKLKVVEGKCVVRYLDSESHINIGYNRFLEKIGLREREEVKEPDTTEPDTTKTETLKPDTKEPDTTEKTIELNIQNLLEDYYIQRKEREEFEKQKEENKQLALKLKKLCAIATNNSLTEESLLDVKEVIAVDSKTEDTSLSNSELVYELMLKALKEKDSISIPIEYFKKLKTTIRKNLFLNMSCTKYTALANIKISDTSNNTIFALVNYDDAEDYVRITVLKGYNSNKISDNDIAIYELNYNKWKKEHSWIS